MISFLTSLKPFRGTTAVQQRNALRSWRAVVPDSEIIVFGTVEGAADLLAEVNATYRQDLVCNEFGTPLISAMFAEAQRISRHSVLCYINGDIILLPDFAAAIARLSNWKTFTAVGQCLGLDLAEPIDFMQSRWVETLRARANMKGTLREPVAMDFFAFRRGAIGQLPAFAIGRPAWDNFLIKHLLNRRIPIIDLSPVVTPVHQNHDYMHVPCGKGMAWEGPEANCNRRLAALEFPDFHPAHYSIWNAPWVMHKHFVVPALSPRRILWRFNATFSHRNRERVKAFLRLPRRVASRLFRKLVSITKR
jgi:hypothetical protein